MYGIIPIVGIVATLFSIGGKCARHNKLIDDISVISQYWGQRTMCGHSYCTN